MNDSLPDVQSTTDGHHRVEIDEVGVSDIRYPIVLPVKEGGQQHTVASISMTVGLDAKYKGTHMSRFMRVLSHCGTSANCGPWDAPTLPKLLLPRLLDELGATRAQVRVSFPYFLSRFAPVTCLGGLNAYDCWIAAALVRDVGRGACDYHVEVGADVPIATLCPCSREISDRGAHNQRGHVRLAVGHRRHWTGAEWQRYVGDVAIEGAYFEDLIEAVEKASSCVLYPVLKRPDEKAVTETAYDNPRFVEDVVRGVATFVESWSWDWAHVRSVNHESIHQHNAVARVFMGKGSELIHDWI